MRPSTGPSLTLAMGAALIAAAGPAYADEHTPSPQDADAGSAGDARVIIVTAPGVSLDIATLGTVSRADIYRTGGPDALASLTREIAGVSLQDAQGNPWQPNLAWRGFVVSPLQGQAQGLAAYLDGGRFNLPFGDTVPFDVVPDAALTSLTITGPSPAQGLNALGGVLAMETATGRSAPGVDLTAQYGRFDEREASAAAGGSGERFSWFAAAQYRAEDGWRDFSPSELYNGYLDLGYDAPGHGVHVKIVGADSDLTGNGVAPVELLAARRQSVFTHPDRSRTRYARLSAHPWLALGEHTRLEATGYYQRLTVRSLNGDAADIEACEDELAAGLLCLETVGDDEGEEEAAAILTDAAGDPIADVLDGEDYGVRNRGRVRTRSGGVLLQLVDERALLGGTNRLAIGASYDASRSRFAARTELGELTEARGVDPLGPVIVQADGAIAPVSLVARTRYAGVFVADSLPLGEAVTLDLGLRYNHARITLDDQIGTALNGDHRFERVNPGVAASWRASDRLTLRAAYSESNRTPTPAELSCADEDAPCSLANFFIADPPLKQVVARSWELGAKGEALSGGWRIGWSAAAWRTTNRDDIQFVASEIRGRAYFRNIGRTRRQGVDLGLDAAKGALRLSAGYAFLDATFRTPLTLSSPANPFADEGGAITVAPGDRLSALPRHSASLSADWAGRGFSLGADMIARSGQRLLGDEAGQNPNVPGYAIVNLRGSVDLAPGLALFGELRNALNRDYATFGTFSEVDEVELAEAPGASDPRAYGPGAPRRWALGLRARF